MSKEILINERYFVQSLAKGLKILQIFCEENTPLSLSEIADKMGTNRQLATRFCYTLCQLGFIQKDQQKLYRLTPRVLTLGYPAICSFEWLDIARYYLNELFGEINETVSLCILEKTEIVFAIRITKKEYLPIDIHMGTKLPVYCTSMGKSLLAFQQPSITRAVVKKLKFRPLTSHTILTEDRFLDELKKVRLRGYAVNDEELSLGNRTVGAPILNKNNYAVAAIDIAAPTSAYSMREMEDNLVPDLLRTAKLISESLIKIKSPFLIDSNSISGNK